MSTLWPILRAWLASLVQTVLAKSIDNGGARTAALRARLAAWWADLRAKV